MRCGVAEAVFGRRLLEATLPPAALDWVLARKEALAVVALMAVAAVLRFYDLGAMALHHDESLHARYSWLLFDGQGYQHNPLMHGPFLFHSGALTYFLFGDSDATSRFMPALFGTALVGMPFLLRKQIGMQAVLIAAVLLTVSPTILYFSRFFRNELFMLVWTLGIVICIWRYLDEERERYLYVMAALLALSFATKEVTFITAAITLLFLNLMFAVELGKRREGERIDGTRVVLRTVILAPVAWVIAAAWSFLPGRLFGLQRLPAVGDVLVLFGILTLPQFAAAIQVLPFVTNHGYANPEENTLRTVTVTSLLLLGAYAGLLWRPRVFAIAAACFFVPYVLLYTTFFTNMDGFFSGIWGSLDYWLDQHHVKRGNQPPYYYALLTPLYEFLPMLLALGGAVWLMLRGNSLSRWLVFWTAGIFIGLTAAGEKMPWLEAHIALPMVLVAAVVLAKLIEALELNGARWLTAAGAAAVSVVAVILVVDGDGLLRWAGGALFAALGAWLAVTLRDEPPPALGSRLRGSLLSTELHVTVLLIALAAVLLVLAATAGVIGIYAAVWVAALLPVVLAGYVLVAIIGSSKALGRGLLAISIAVLFALTVRASLTASFQNKDTPVEMLVYTQTSPDIPKIMDRIDSLAKASGLGYNLRVVIDNQDSYAWPWAWYLRRYHEVSYADFNREYTPPANAVLLIHRVNAGQIDESAYATAPYKHRWWFCESYRDLEGTCRVDGGLSFEAAARIATDGDKLKSIANFWLYRRPAEGHTGSVDGVAFFPLSLSAFDVGPGPQLTPRHPVTLADGRIVLGSGNGTGSRTPGEFLQPAGLFVDTEGSLWVADGLNNRVQKFDSQGRFLAQITSSGAAPGGLREPWSVAVDAQGFVYVADTWNHRIQKFSPDLRLVGAWGQPGAGDNPGPLDFFGPRDVEIAADGTLWITDTGNNRLLHFSPDGEPLDVMGTAPGGPVAYKEPVGLVFDAQGNLLVSDAWSGRILRFDSSFNPAGSFDVGWTSEHILAKPYVAVLTDGRLVVAMPEASQLLLFDATGRRLGAWQPLNGSMPAGVVAMPDGGFAYSDIVRHEVQIVPAALIAQLFR
jgi:predicted membrane-bound mannosyltransferase/DNA-binding beta-propeller fold protein YncE